MDVAAHLGAHALHEIVELAPFPAHDRFDAAVVEIAHPTDETERICHLSGRPPETYSLDVASEVNVQLFLQAFHHR
jgi:hypothetical protein